ncbi:transposase family protein [Anaerocolumna xylanovorans]|uniref:transposase family protein n=1 Tax=Anaerocolumna xylanovorans TaxID=100134 RepID=UPI000936D0FC
MLVAASKVQEQKNQYEDVRPIPKLNIEELTELDCVRPMNDFTSLLFHCEPVKRYSGACLKCGKSHNYYSNGKSDRLVHDISMGLVHIDIIVKSPRYECNECGETFTYPFQSLIQGKQFTKRLYEQIYKCENHHTKF